MRKAKNSIIASIAGVSDSSKDSDSVTQSTALPAPSMLSLLTYGAITCISQVRRGADNLALVSAKSKSCSNLPAIVTETDSPLLTLLLSGASFLNAAVMVGDDDGDGDDRFYKIDTQGTRSIISREDQLRGGTAHVGEIVWLNERESRLPGARSNAMIQMAHGRQYLVDSFLRRAKFSSSRLFNIPHYPHTLKWKHSGGLYKLVLSKSKLVVATLEPSMSSEAPRIKVFESFHELDGSHPQLEYRGIPILVLDFIIATALLVVADKDECRIFTRKSESPVVRSSTLPLRSSSQSTQRWRSDVHTEPFPNFLSRPISPSRSLVGHSASSELAVSTSQSEFGSVSRHNNSEAHPLLSDRSRGPNFRPQTTPAPPRQRFTSVCSESDEGEEDASQADDILSGLSQLSYEQQATAEGPDGNFAKRHTRPRSASDSGVSSEAPSQFSAGSQSPTPWFLVASAPVPQDCVVPSTTGSRRPFRPLPRIPVLGAGDIPPVPSLPPSPMAFPTSYSPERSVAGPSHLSTSFVSKGSPEGTLRRTPSETTIMPLKYSPGHVSQSYTSTDASLSNPVHRRSIYKCADPPSTQYNSGPSYAHRTMPADPALHLSTYSNRDSELFASSSCSHSSPPSVYPPPSHWPEDEYSGFFPPPSYDSIDFS